MTRLLWLRGPHRCKVRALIMDFGADTLLSFLEASQAAPSPVCSPPPSERAFKALVPSQKVTAEEISTRSPTEASPNLATSSPTTPATPTPPGPVATMSLRRRGSSVGSDMDEAPPTRKPPLYKNASTTSDFGDMVTPVKDKAGDPSKKDLSGLFNAIAEAKNVVSNEKVPENAQSHPKTKRKAHVDVEPSTCKSKGYLLGCVVFLINIRSSSSSTTTTSLSSTKLREVLK